MPAGGQNRLFDGLFADPEIAALFSAERMIAQFLAFEVALTRAWAQDGTVPRGAQVAARMADLRIDPHRVALGVRRDGVPVPAFVAEVKRAMGDDAASVHIGATSQDLMDTALGLNLRGASAIYAARLQEMLQRLANLRRRHGSRAMMGRTRMQAALPIKVADRLDAWAVPLARTLDRLPEVQTSAVQIQFGGPVGQRDARTRQVAAQVAIALDLPPPGPVWHSARDGVVGYGNWLALVTGSLGKLGQDLALMAQQGIDEVRLSGGGTSSAMVHKHNPIAAETLVTLARFNAVQAGGLHQAMVHEQERSGAAWALEWMLLPQMCEATGAALSLAIDLLDSIESLGHDPD